MALTGAKALMVWCQQVTNGYKDVNIRNMTSAWRDGLGFCAILHHYRPDLINFDKLSKENIAENNHMAFTIAENELGIAALLDVEDMVEMEVPDKLSILTYISQYYQYFRDKVPGEIPPPARHPSKRHAAFTSHDVPRKKVPGTTPGVSATKEVIGANPTPKMSKGTMDRFCAKCRENVYLMERLQVEGRLFHRVCFKCFTCGTQLRMGTYRYIPAEDQFYCDQHYRKRTTSTSSDESRSLQRSGSQQNEQDALQNLLKSLENKRKANEAPKEEIATGSLHTRVENARKKFQQAEHMDTDTDVFHDHKLDNVKVPGKEPSHQPPLRPSTPPVKRTKETDMKVTLPEFLKKSRDLKPVDSKSTENIPPRPVNRPAKKLHASSDDMHHISKGVHIDQLKNLYEGAGVIGKPKDGAPSRPPNPPSQQKTIQVDSADDGIVSNSDSGGVVHARNFLSNVLPKHPNELGHHSQPGFSKGEEATGVHIYESPFQVNINQHDNSDKGGLDNPRYGEKIEIKPPLIYENEGPSLLSLERNNSAGRKEIIDGGLPEEHKDVSRPKSDSVLSSSSEGAKKKKMVLKVKKKKKKDIEQEHKGAYEEGEESVADDSMNKAELELNKSGAQMTNVNVESIEQNIKEAEEDIKEQILDENTEDVENKNIEPATVSSEAIDNQSDLISNNVIDVKNINKDIPDHQNDSEISDETSKQAEEIAIDVNSSENEVNGKTHSSPNKIAENSAEHLEEASDKVQGNKDEDFLEKDEEDIAPKLKVVTYVNPFEESDDEILDNHDDDDAIDRSKAQTSLNPFDMSDEDEIIGNTSEIANSEAANTRESGVTNPIRIRPGTGPKIQASPEQIQQHQQKIFDLKKDMMETGKKPVKYKNPFEDSDDDILDEPRCQVKDSKEVKDSEKEAKHRKKLVLKVKKHNKGPAPRPCPEKFGNKVEKTIVESKMEGPTPPSNPFEDSDDNLLVDERMETFKAYVENVDIEMNKEKRLDVRKISRESNQLDQEETGMISPVSASCPSLVRTRSDGGNNGTEHRPGSSERINDRQSILNHHAGRLYSKDIGYVPVEKDNDEKRSKPMLQKEESKEIYDLKGAALKKKEAAPKRPAPPIPKGVQPFREQKDIEPAPVEGKRVLEIKNNVAVGQTDEKSKVTKKEKEKKDGKKKIVVQKENEEIITETKKSKQKLPKTKKKKKNKNKSQNTNENENEGIKTENIANIVKEEPESYFIEENELTLEEIGIELKTIESRQRELERKGVKMEKKLREQLHGEPEENYMITWFDLVTEKNKILRRENELIYMSQEIEYHNNQKRIEYELRLLMEKDESTKTEEDREAEEQLLAQLVNYVSRRNKIVEKMEEDRLREREEDEQIQMVMRAQGLTKGKKKKAGKKTSSTTFYD